MIHTRGLFTTVFIFFIAGIHVSNASLTGTKPPDRPILSAKTQMSFEPNRGQTAMPVQFLSHGAHHTLFLTPQSAVLRLTTDAKNPKKYPEAFMHETLSGVVLRTVFAGSSPHARIAGQELLPSRSNYFIGNDPKQWHTDVPHFGRS